MSPKDSSSLKLENIRAILKNYNYWFSITHLLRNEKYDKSRLLNGNK